MATEKQIQKMLGILVEHLELFLVLLGEHAQWVIENPKEAIKLFVNAVKNRESDRWRVRDGVIYFTVTSDGTTGQEWIKRLEGKGFQISKWAKDLLTSSGFKPTTGITTEIAVLPGKIFNDGGGRITKKIRTEAKERNLTEPNAEVSCLIREEFSDEVIEAIGFWWIVVFHEPIDSVGDPYLLAVSRHGDGRWLSAGCGNPGDSWDSGGGFAFAVS